MTLILLDLLVSYGYLAVLLVITLECMGLPAPGKTVLLVAAVTAGTTHQLSLPLVIGAAAAGLSRWLRGGWSGQRVAGALK